MFLQGENGMKNVLKTVLGRIVLVFIVLAIIVLVGFFVVNSKKSQQDQTAEVVNDVDDIEAEDTENKTAKDSEENHKEEGEASDNSKKEDESDEKNLSKKLKTTSKDEVVNNSDKMRETVLGTDNVSVNANSSVLPKSSSSNASGSSSNVGESLERNTNSESRQLSEAEKYYQESGEIVEIIDASHSKNVPTEKEAEKLLRKNLFNEYPITYEYSMGGEYVGGLEITSADTVRRPVYQTIFVNDNDEVWSVFVINGAIYANPVTYNLESQRPVQLLISESKEITSYDDVTNKYFVTLPKESALVVKVVDKINAETLNKLTCEEISNL